MDIIKKKSLKKQRKSRVISFKPSGQKNFKVGYGGNVSDIYNNNPNTYLNEVLEEKAKKRQIKRNSLYKI